MQTNHNIGRCLVCRIAVLACAWCGTVQSQSCGAASKHHVVWLSQYSPFSLPHSHRASYILCRTSHAPRPVPLTRRVPQLGATLLPLGHKAATVVNIRMKRSAGNELLGAITIIQTALYIGQRAAAAICMVHKGALACCRQSSSTEA